MTIKDHTRFGEWKFYLVDPVTGADLKIPIGEPKTQSLPALVQLVAAQMEEFDRITDNKYSAKARQEASNKGMNLNQYISLLIEHQICVRSSNSSDLCWSNGVGDVVHGLFTKVDGLVANLPAPLKRIAASIIEKITPSSSQTLGGCSSCGGTRSFTPDASNRGRVGKLNDIS